MNKGVFKAVKLRIHLIITSLMTEHDETSAEHRTLLSFTDQRGGIKWEYIFFLVKSLVRGGLQMVSSKSASNTETLGTTENREEEEVVRYSQACAM